MAQDPALDNLAHPPGTATTPWGELGRVTRAGDGTRTLLFLPGLGFGDEVWKETAARHAADFRTIAVTLPGFGGTPPLPMPIGDAAPFAELAWTRSSLAALERLLDEERPRKVTVVAHWALASQLALRLALDHPDRVEGLILVGGVLKAYYDNSPQMLHWTPAQRAGFAEGMGQHWFRTVTRDTWDDNNFMSYDYATNPRRALDLWRQAASPTLPVWIRYLLEFYTMDPSAELAKLKVPVLVLQPDFADPAFYVDDGRNYMRNLCLDSWQGVATPGDAGPPIRFVPVPGSRLFVQYDRPEAQDAAIRELLAGSPPRP